MIRNKQKHHLSEIMSWNQKLISNCTGLAKNRTSLFYLNIFKIHCNEWVYSFSKEEQSMKLFASNKSIPNNVQWTLARVFVFISKNFPAYQQHFYSEKFTFQMFVLIRIIDKKKNEQFNQASCSIIWFISIENGNKSIQIIRDRAVDDFTIHYFFDFESAILIYKYFGKIAIKCWNEDEFSRRFEKYSFCHGLMIVIKLSLCYPIHFSQKKYQWLIEYLHQFIFHLTYQPVFI